MKRAALGGIGVDSRWLGHQIKKLVCFSEVAPSAIGSSLKEFFPHPDLHPFFLYLPYPHPTRYRHVGTHARQVARGCHGW